MALTIFDSDILINVGRGDSVAINCLQDYSVISTPAVSVVTQMELIVGCRNKIELRQLKTFLKHFQVLQITPQISENTVDLMENIV